MIKYKVLVTGNNASVIDSFFHQMENNFEALTTSIRYADIIRHMNCYEPDAFVYCLHNEPRDHIMQMASVKYKLAQEDIPFILLGSKEECDEFEKMAVNVADLILYRPLSAEAIQERILKFFKGKKPVTIDRFEQVTLRFHNKRFPDFLAFRHSGQKNYRYVSGGAGSPQFFQNDNAVLIRHFVVQQDQIRFLFLQKF